jgi:L-ascorbate 6-phosphate lactonase
VLTDHRRTSVDGLLAPNNGRDTFRTNRNLIENFTAREAADLAEAAGVRLLIPTHWDLFPENAENPGHLFEYLGRHHPDPPCHSMARSERFVYFPCR